MAYPSGIETWRQVAIICMDRDRDLAALAVERMDRSPAHRTLTGADADFTDTRVHLLWRQGEHERALAMVRELQRTEPARIDVIASLLVTVGREEEVVALVPADSTDPVLLLQRGRGLKKLGRLDEATATVERLVQLGAPLRASTLRGELRSGRER